MILYIEDLIREINILNWYRGEAMKRMDEGADLVQTDCAKQDALLYHLRCAVNDVVLMANHNRVRFECEEKDDALVFSIAPIREGREYLKPVLKQAIRLYIVAEVRRLWMMGTRPDWADSTLREELRMRIADAMNDVTDRGERIRRRATTMGI